MTWEYRGLQRGYRGLQGVPRGYKGLQKVTGGYMGLQGVTGTYKGLQRMTGGDKGFQGVTKDYGNFFLTREFPDTFSWSILVVSWCCGSPNDVTFRPFLCFSLS